MILNSYGTTYVGTDYQPLGTQNPDPHSI